MDDSYNIGDALFYDKVNDCIVNLAHEDSESQIFFDFQQYTALGTIINIENGRFRLLTPNFTNVLVNGLSDVDEKELTVKIEQIVSDTGKCFERECGVQPTVKLSVMSDKDIDAIVNNCKTVINGMLAIAFYCKQFLENSDFMELLTDTNIAYLNDSGLNILLGGFGAEMNRLDMNVISDFEKRGYYQERTVELVRDNMPVDEFIKMADKMNSGVVEFVEEDELEPEPVEIPEVPAILPKSFKDIREEFPKADLIAFYVVPVMEIQIER